MFIASRQQALLAAVIERYVESAEAVGSSTLAADPRIVGQFGHLSSATIRNDLAELEAAGLLAQPHTSAGRVPTHAGYRLYINEMLRPRPVRAAERSQIQTRIATPISSVEDALREATALLAKMTGYPAVASLPAANRDTMRHLQINPLPPHRLILVLVTAAGRIEHRLFEVDKEVPVAHITTVVNFLNEKLGGQPLAALRTLKFEDVSTGLHDAQVLNLARRAWELVSQSVADVGDDRIVVQGLITLLDEPEFSDISEARAAMRLFEDEAAMTDILRASLPLPASQKGQKKRPHTIVIGSELADVSNPAMHQFSFVGISYGANGEVLGTVGVMGPTRMKYADAASIVPVLAGRLQECLETM
jgi:heat-inducible transcriptional repressor